MSKLLLVVKDGFEISGRGATVAPFVSPEVIGTSQNGHKQQVRLARPDGTEEIVEATFYWQHSNPGGFHFSFFLGQGRKEQVPPGTEIWRSKPINRSTKRRSAEIRIYKHNEDRSTRIVYDGNNPSVIKEGKDMIQSITSKLLFGAIVLLGGIGLVFLTLAILRSTLPYNSEGNYFDGVVNYHEQSVFAYGMLAAVSFLAAVILFAIRRLVRRAGSKTD